MKRNLDPTKYELNETEREQIWYGIRRRTTGGSPGSGGRTHTQPALAITAVAATIILAVAWHLGSDKLLQPKAQVGHDQVAVLELDAAPQEGMREVQPAPVARAMKQAKPSATITGRVLDKESREPLPYVVVKVAGMDLTAVTDSLGVFRFDNLPAGKKVKLEARLLSYQPLTVAVQVPQSGAVNRDFDLKPVLVATLQAFDVEGAEYMMQVKPTGSDHNVSVETFDKYAIDSVEDARSRKAGLAAKGAELLDRDRVAATPAAPPSVTGGTTPPNGETFELMYFHSAGVNPFVATEDDSLSTFALDVDNASWTLARSYLERGVMPPPAAIRVEEFVNAFDAGWPQQSKQAFAIHTEGARSRFGKGYHLLRVGLVGQQIPQDKRRPANLVFVIDVSGSMSGGNRLGQVKSSLHTLLAELREGDRVGLVIYGSNGQVRLPLTDVSRREVITQAIDALQTGGSTNAAEGLALGYQMARDNYEAGRLNRLILCSDGVANTGASTEAGGILDLVRKASDEGITLTTIGFGMGNYNDVMMEKLADQGDGNYFYVDQPAEADRVFRENLTGLLQNIAREAKVQVDFNRDLVQRWRLLGYENRAVADEDFRNNNVDAGEVGAGHQVTALYELKLKQPADREVDADGNTASPLPAPALRVGTVRLRWQAPAHDTDHAGEVTELAQPFLLSQFAGSFATGSAGMRVQTVVAEFAELLRNSYWAQDDSLANLVPVADALARDLPADKQVQELAQLVRKAADIAAADK